MRIFINILLATALLSIGNASPVRPEAAPGQIEVGPTGNVTFSKYRPQYHFLAPTLWMNDPCAPWYDTTTELYHMYYQHNPFAEVWGNMTWGHAVSKDLVVWEDKPFAIRPDKPFDYLGVFDGTLVTRGYQDLPTLLYAGVSILPLSWLIGYTPGAEKQILAVTKDNGDTWEKIGPVISAPPDGFNVTGFRDPYLFKSPTFDKLLGVAERGSYYTTISSGIHGEGPRLWLFHSINWYDWIFLGPLVTEPANTTFSDRYSGRFGFNFEVATYFPLEDSDGNTWHFVTVGSEGGRSANDHGSHWPIWMGGEIAIGEPDGKETREKTPRLITKMAGVADWGTFYAGITFEDSKKPRRIQSGWVYEDIIGVNPQGWAGMLAIPRELFIAELDNVLASDPHLTDTTTSWIAVNMNWHQSSASLKSIRTLGIRPIQEFARLRRHATNWNWRSLDISSSISSLTTPIHSDHLEIEITFRYKSTAIPISPFGLAVREDPSGVERTSIWYDPQTEELTVDRSLSSKNTTLYNTATERGALPLFQLYDHHSRSMVWEPLKLHIFVDNSVIEIYANNRFALTTRVYPTLGDANGVSLAWNEGVEVEEFEVFYDIQTKAWPSRQS